MREHKKANPAVSATAALAIAAIILGGIPGRAAASAGNYGAHVAYAKSKDASEGHYLVGGHAELALAPILGVQGAVDYRSEESFAVATPAGTAGMDVRSIPVTVTGRLYLPSLAPVRPFVLGGAGWYRVIYDYSEALENTLGVKDQHVSTFGWHVGAGASLALSPALSLDGEARYSFVDPERKLDREVRETIRDFNYDSLNLALGLSLGF